MPPKRILLIEDDAALAELIADYLNDFEFKVKIAENGNSAITKTRTESFDLVICDVGLPDIDGFTLLPRLNIEADTPTIYLTAVSDRASQIRGLNSGACDYIIKPVDPELLLARVRANIRKLTNGSTRNKIEIKSLHLDNTRQLAKVDQTLLPLTSQEFQVLWFFAKNPGSIISRDHIFEELIGRPYDGKDRAADLRVSRLRKKLLDIDIDKISITSVRNQGYIFTIHQ